MRSGLARSALRARLEARCEEIEAAALTRVKAISDPDEISDPAYAEGLRAAVGAAVAYGIETTGREGGDAPIPVTLLAQARMAARVGISLETVLRRYFAGYSLLGYFILEEAANAGMTDGAELKRLLGAHAGIFDRLLEAIGEEYSREAKVRFASSGQRQAEQIERLLAGELVDISAIPYDFDGWHLGVVAEGAEVERRVRGIAADADCRLLCVSRDEDVVWGWLGSRRRLDPDGLLRQLAATQEDCGMAISLGEPAENIDGWRFTHRQALAGLGIALRGAEKLVRYIDVAVLASALRDNLLADSLRRFYLEPLKDGRDGGDSLRETLRAYLEHEHNSASTAAALGVTRQTINSRLRMIEGRIGRPLSTCSTELEVALRLQASEQTFSEKANLVGTTHIA